MGTLTQEGTVIGLMSGGPRPHSYGEPVLVLGATGQQGGAVARTLRAEGWPVRALVRDATAPAARRLEAEAIDLVTGDFADVASIRSAMAGAYGVFSVQPSSGQPGSGVTDDDEVLFGTIVADLAEEAGVEHFIYSSANAVGALPTGVAHFDTKWRIERHLQSLDMATTIIRPAAFFEMLVPPGALRDDSASFFMRNDQPMQFIAVADIGRIAARLFREGESAAGRTIEIAGDSLTGDELASALSRAAGRPVGYSRFSDLQLRDSPLLASLAALVDVGRLAGNADLELLNAEFGPLLTLDAWLPPLG